MPHGVTVPPNPYTQMGQMTLGAPNNPYLQNAGQQMASIVNQGLTQQVLPSIGRGAVATGGYGGSRQGIAEGLAIGQAQQGLNQALGNMYLNSYGMDQNFYNAQRGQDLQQQQQGFNQYLGGLDANLRAGQTLYGIGQQQQQAPWTSMQNLMNILNPLMGQTGSNSVKQPDSGGGLSGALGGAFSIAQVLNLLSKPGG